VATTSWLRRKNTCKNMGVVKKKAFINEQTLHHYIYLKFKIYNLYKNAYTRWT